MYSVDCRLYTAAHLSALAPGEVEGLQQEAEPQPAQLPVKEGPDLGEWA
jgi:hypothetical protein